MRIKIDEPEEVHVCDHCLDTFVVKRGITVKEIPINYGAMERNFCSKRCRDKYHRRPSLYRRLLK